MVAKSTSLLVSSAVVAAALALTTPSCGTKSSFITHAEAKKRNFGAANEDNFDASFYDRRAPNEDEYAYRSEQMRNEARGKAPSSSFSALAGISKEDQIMLIEDDLHDLRQTKLTTAIQKASNAQGILNHAKSGLPWFPSKEDRERIVLLENNVNRHNKELATVHAEERALELRLKPLYGIVSRQFWNEQRRAISNSIDTVHKMAKDNAWYSGLFSIGKVDSIQELVMHVIGQYVIASAILYIFGLLFFAFWTAPWTVYEYSSSIVDVVPAVVSYVLAVGLMCLPMILFVGALALLYKYMVRQQQMRGGGGGDPFRGDNNANGPAAAAAERAQQQRQREQQAHQQQQQARYAPPPSSGLHQRPRGATGGFGGPVADID